MVGFGEIPQHIPRSVTVSLPSEVTLLVTDTDVEVMDETEPVTTVGAIAGRLSEIGASLLQLKRKTKAKNRNEVFIG